MLSARRLPLQFAFGALVAAIVVLVLHETFLRELHFDDAYMFLRYAGNLLATGDYGWNPGERTYGCTSIGYTLFVTVVRFVRLDAVLGPGRALQVSALFWALAATVLLARVVRYAARGTVLDDATARRGLLVAFIAAPITFVNVLTGMDTTFSLFSTTFILWCWFRFEERPTTTRWVLALVSGYLAFLVRPDNGIYALLFPWLFLRNIRQPTSRIVATYGVLIGLFALDTLLKARYFGNPMPLPFFAKSRGFYEGYIGIFRWNNLEFTFDFFLTYGGVLFLLAVLLPGAPERRAGWVFLLPMLATVAYYFSVTQIMGQWSRYYLPSAPFLIAGLLVSLRGTRPSDIAPERVAWAFLALVVFLLGRQIVAARYGSIRVAREQAVAARYIKEDPDLAGGQEFGDPWWKGITTMSAIAGRLPAGSTIAATEHGYVAAMNPKIRVLDLCGLHNPQLALHGWSDDQLRASNPEVIWMPHREYVGLYHRVRTGSYFNSAYEFFPRALSFGVAIRKDSAHRDEIRAILERGIAAP